MGSTAKTAHVVYEEKVGWMEKIARLALLCDVTQGSENISSLPRESWFLVSDCHRLLGDYYQTPTDSNDL